jgi:hypothetical protein
VNKKLFGISALVVWSGMVLRFAIDLFDLAKNATPTHGLFGGYVAGVSGAPARIFDSLSYFTIWSNIGVAIVVTMLYINPSRDSKIFRVMRNTTLLMIALTGILYVALIAPYEKVYGLNIVANVFEHYVTPMVAVIVWVIAGPRGWMTFKDSLKIYVVPIIYLAFTLVKGAITHRYPYTFFNVVKYGYGPVSVTIGVIIVGAYLFIALLVWLDKFQMRKAASTK